MLKVFDILRPADKIPPGGKSIVVMPAYNAARTLERTLRDFPVGEVDEIILVDDGMPLVKYLANRGLTTIENVWLGHNLGDAPTGFRAYSQCVLETIPWDRNSNDFVFDSHILIQCVHCTRTRVVTAELHRIA